MPCGPRTPGAPPSALPWHAEAMRWSVWGPAGSPLEQAQAARRRAAILCVLCAMQCDTRVIPGYSGYDSGYTRVFGWAAFWTHFWLYEGKKLELRAAARPDLELRLSADPLPDRPASGRSLIYIRSDVPLMYRGGPVHQKWYIRPVFACGHAWAIVDLAGLVVCVGGSGWWF